LGQSIYQQIVKLPVAQGRIIQTSSWVINGMPAGIIFREGISPKPFEDSNPFLLHTVRGAQPSTFQFKMNKNQQKIRQNIYSQYNNKNNIYGKYGGSAKMIVTTQKKYGGLETSVPHTSWISYKK